MVMRVAVAVACVMLGACTVEGRGKSAMPTFKTYTKPHALAPDARQFTLVPFTIEVTSAVLEERYTVVSKGDWAVRLDLLVTNRNSQAREVRPDVGIEVVDAQCEVGLISEMNWDDPAWERLPQSTLLRAGATARMYVHVGCKHADKLGDAFYLSLGSTKILLRRQ